MRLSKDYWLWGLFPTNETDFLNKIKAEVQSVLESPEFETHITLAGPYLNVNNKFLDKLKTFCETNTTVLLDIDRYDSQQEKFKSFYISIKKSEHLKKLRRNLYELDELDITNNYYPHISLSYGNHQIKKKEELISKLPKLKKTIKLSKIALVEVYEDLDHWKISESFDLN